MDWWQYILLYLGIWLLGFFTGMNAGISTAMLKITRLQGSPGNQPSMPDLATLQGLMNSQVGRGL